MARRISLSKVIRRTHLLVALFLTPWILMYALSTFTMHHRALLTGENRRVAPDFNVVDERAYTPSFAPGTDRRTAAEEILREVDLVGAYTVRGDLEEGTLTILRQRPFGSYRITYSSESGTIRIERQRFAMAFFLEMLHRRRGYDQPFLANDAWALIVDTFILAIVVWAATGLWMFWELAATRRLGALFLGAGVAFFVLCLLLL